jgi:hypothetical protein
VEKIGPALIFPTLPTAVAAFQEHHGALPPGIRHVVLPPDPWELEASGEDD